ncbi:hypothetical protein [Oryzicola mucosus]|uniref:DUF3035 domain-containing protein n=1 Tax=Oryzicola mucosus TaxID=2767425 RepID=A0A8J6PU62_9HYPH|nr:hypothetical protein [Oryzicola mucosus]MBD0415709.1 hypothetical protein [Oryzicola mucosus]
MTDRKILRGLWLAPLVVSGLAMTGCASAPTYGTDKSASEQLAGDLTGMFSLAPKTNNINYKPRPELVKPAPGQREQLPAPQENIVVADAAQWPESPEERRKRIRDEATANQNNPFYKPQVVNDMTALNGPDMSTWTPAQRKAEIERRLRESKQGSSNTRRYLSEPPLAYRAPAATAAQNELGEDEFKKERARKRAAKGGSGLFDWLPSF